MTSKTQKFHLQTLGNSSNMIDANLDQAIRRSNVKSFVKNGIGIGNQNDLADVDNNTGLEEHLLNLKKSCSNLMRDIHQSETGTLKYKDQTFFTEGKSKKIKDDRQSLDNRVSDLQKSLQNVQLKKEAAAHGTKTYQHILQRMKKDDIFFQFNKNYLERQLKTLEKSHSLTSAKHNSISEFQQLSKMGLKEARQELKQQKGGREMNYNSIHVETHRKLQKQTKLKKREKQTQLIQQLAADDIQDADLIKLKKFMTVQLFLRQMLKGKILNLKKHYEPFEQAFLKIKSNTKVKDANSLKYEFATFQNSYTQKTGWVKNLEIQIAAALQTKKSHEQKLYEFKISQMQMTEEMQMTQKSSTITNRKQLNEKSIQYEVVWQRIHAWIEIQSKKLKINNQKTDLTNTFKGILQKIKVEPTNAPKKQQKTIQKIAVVQKKQSKTLPKVQQEVMIVPDQQKPILESQIE